MGRDGVDGGLAARSASARRRFAAAAIGATAGRQALRAVLATPRARSRLERTNFRGEPVSLGGGPSLAIGAVAGAVAGADDAALAAAVAVAGLGAGVVGGYDDAVGARPDQRAAKGFRGHLTALRQGRLTSGAVKIVGVGASALVAAALIAARPGRRRGPVDLVVDAGLIAGAANLVNLLDLRPGRALKAGILLGAPLALRRGRAAGAAAGTVGAAAALLPEDLAEQTMLGDAGANALGALLGTALAAGATRTVRVTALAAIAGLTAASEKISFTRVIASTPVLRELDAFGRRAN